MESVHPQNLSVLVWRIRVEGTRQGQRRIRTLRPAEGENSDAGQDGSYDIAGTWLHQNLRFSQKDRGKDFHQVVNQEYRER